jgi:glutathione peroxidase
MIKKIKYPLGFLTLFTLLVTLTSFNSVNGIYDYSITKIEGGTLSLNTLQNKRLLIITLPTQQNASNDSLLYCLDTLASAHINNLTVIGIPAIEDGYTAAQQTQLKNWYRAKLGTYITIGTGMYTRKTSGTNQHGLFKWLTNDALNNIFNADVTGPWQKFFISTTGELFGELAPQTRISSAAVQRTLRI